MKLEKLGNVLKKLDIDPDSIKDDLEAAVKEEVDIVKKEVALKAEKKVMHYLDSEKGKKQMIKKINDAIDIPWISESMEEKIFTVIFNVISGAIKKVIKKEK